MNRLILGALVIGLQVTPVLAGTQAPAKTAVATQISIRNPAHYAGIQLGDILQRTLQVSVAQEDQLNEGSLPLKGLLRNGIELRGLHVSSQAQGSQKRYTLVFDYQVFASSGTPVQLQLPAEQISFNSGKVAQLPPWRFWLMAQLPDRLQVAKTSLLPQYRPSQRDTRVAQQGLVASAFLVLLGSLMLLYRHADWAWLPIMNGPFARACRQLKHLPATREGEKQAALLLQGAFNQRFGQQMLASHIADFVADAPGFRALQREIETFFEQSSQVLYGASSTAAAHLPGWKIFARQLRDCERSV